MTSDIPDAEGGQMRASTLELFFDLVFVFTVTQLTHAFTEHPGWPALGRVVLVFALTWWMYSGYVWLTNEVAPTSTARRTGLLVGMFGFLVIAVAIPGAFEGFGLAFALGYAVVNVMHSVLFWANAGARVSAAALRLVPPNTTCAVLVLIGGCVHGWPRYLLWAAALMVQIVTPYVFDTGEFVVRTAHFCERHGLVLLIAIGESVVAIGAGLAGEDLTIPLLAMVALALTLASMLWWAYFGMDDERGEHALAAVPGPRRGRIAAFAYGYALYPMLVGVILIAAGIRSVLAQGHRSVPVSAALALSGGVALFLFGQCCFRLVLRLPRPWLRLVGASAVLATAPVGVVWVGWAQLLLLVIVGFVPVFADDMLSVRAGEHNTYL
ncbi:low temperature requirement protein A [Nocardia transvalensis]|uniref:low temperature requirement protein A n=1 Tax=Nocardia transvalensis TaxID=37333 RepID=UPI002B4B0023|nr:low temperature requirement protein A [Nocardia transvalensis]